jgi:hypothetical protein
MKYVSVLVALLLAAPAFAQNRPQAPPPVAAPGANEAQLRLVVIDVTQSGIPTANVTITTEGRPDITVTTDTLGIVTVPALPVGPAKVRIEFAGFETAEGTVDLRRGPNNQTVELKLAGVTDEVIVSSEDPLSNARGGSMVTSISKAEIATLPDDPEMLQKYLEDLAGPEGATFYMNGFTGGRMPPKEEIRAIRIRSNSFAADGHESGGRQQIEIITRPSTGAFSGNVTFGYQSDALNARHAQALVETPEGNKQIQMQFRGPIVKDKTSFSFNVTRNSQYRSNAIIAVNYFGSQVRVPSDTQNFSGNIEHALTRNQTLRLTYQGTKNEGFNQGLTQFDLPERATETRSSGNLYRAQVQGLVGREMLNEVRFELNRRHNETTSVSNAPAIIVPEAFSMGGAGITRRSESVLFELADNFDFTPHRNHQVRVGLLLQGGFYDNFDETNPNGRTTYASIADHDIDLKLQTTQRLGTYDTSFRSLEAGFYVQDDIRVHNRLSLGIGLRNEMQSLVDDKVNLMPRVGFSWSPFGSTTSVRGGYGIYYDWFESTLYDQTLRLNGVAQQDYTILYEYAGTYDETGRFIPTLDANGKAIEIGRTGGVAGNRGPSNRTVLSPTLELPYVHQASIGVQQQLPANMSVQVTYQKLLGRNQLRGVDINYGELAFDGVSFLRVRPDPTSNIVTEIQSTGRSETDRVTFQARYQVPNQRGFLQFQYQHQRAMSDFGGATSLPSDSSNPGLDWGPQGQDVRHQMQLGGNARLPWQFRVQTQLRVRSAPAYNLTTGLDDNKDGVVNDRPFGVGRNSLRGEATWDIPQFAISKVVGFGGAPPDGAGATGNTGGGFRDQQGGGGQRGGGGRGNNNSNSTRAARYEVEFAVQAQNPLNRVIRSGYTGNLRSPFFGTATSINSARRISFNTSFRF